MSLPHALSGQVIDLLPFEKSFGEAQTRTLVKTPHLEIIRFVLPAEKEWPGHQIDGEITIQCLEGKMSISLAGITSEMVAGQMLYLAGRQQHSLLGIENSLVLVTVLLQRLRQ